MLGLGGRQSAIKDVKKPFGALKSQTDCGIVPEILDSCSVKAPRLEKVPTASGMVPVKKFACNCINAISGKTPMPLTLPESWLLFKSNTVSMDKLRSSLERVPVNSLKSRSMKTRSVNFPISVGMVDESPPCSIPQTANFDKRPISVATVPTMLLFSE